MSEKKESIKIAHKGLWITGAIIFVLGFLGVSAANIYTNYLNIADISAKYLSIYLTDIKASVLIYGAAFLLCFIIAIITNIVIKKNLLKWEETAYFLQNKWTFFGTSAILAIFITASLPYNIARSFIVSTNPTWFVHADPIYGKNIGYYVFQFPLLLDLVKWGFYLVISVLLYTLVIYFMFYIRNGAGGLKEIKKQPQITGHVAVIILTIYGLLGVMSSLLSELLLVSSSLTDSRGGFTDIMVWSNFYKFAPFLLCIIIIVSIIFMARKQIKYMLYSMLVYPAVWVLVFIYALGVQTFYVNPNKATIERPYIKHTIEYTSLAYNIGNVDEKNYLLDGKITAESVNKNISDIENLIIIDEQNAHSLISSNEQEDKYYIFRDANLVPTVSGSDTSAVFSSSREVFIPKDDKTLNEYNNRKMRFTHGLGTKSVNSTTGALVEDSSLEPRIYFGESEKDQKKDYLLVGSSIGEFDGKENPDYKYEGDAGIKMNFLNRVLYAFKYLDPSILFSGNITEDSRIIFNRNIIERAEIALPFLTFDEDPYLIKQKDRYLWVLDGYTTTNDYPYSVRLYDLDDEYGTNYVRNSVKVTVDAYSGQVVAYIIDWDDPIIQTYNKVYPGIFESTLPKELSAHIKYPKTLFKMQTDVYKTFHDTNPVSFYTKDNALEYAMTKTGEKSQVSAIKPHYQTVRHTKDKKELMLMMPFASANNSERLVSVLAASCDVENYGNLTLYKFPTRTEVFGTMHIENKIESNPNVLAEIEKLKSEGNSVIFGQLTPVPIMETVVYIKPVYIRSSSYNLARVIVAYGENITIDSTLSGAFKKLTLLSSASGYKSLKDEPQSALLTEPAEYEALVLSALEKYDEAKQFSTEGDWVNYGKTMDEFEDIFDQIRYYITYPDDQNE